MRLSEQTRLNQADELHVYDFDDTLFDSPLPPEGYDTRAWWLSPQSLAPPHVPAGKESTRKLPAVDSAKRSLASGAYTVLVTGRAEVAGMRQQIQAILKALGLTMHAVVLKENPGPTAEFKRKAVASLLANMPRVEKVAMWDDMADNLKAVSTAASEKNLEFQSNLIKAKTHTESRLPNLEELVLALDARMQGKVAGETSDELGEGRKPYPIGTVRDWKGGKVIKTADGWEKLPTKPLGASSKPDEAPVGGGAATSDVPASTPTGPKGSRRTTKFSLAEAGKVFAVLAADPKNPAAQKAARAAINTLCSDFGMLDRDAGRPGAARMTVVAKTEIPPGVGGVHEWDGGIIVRDKSISRAADLLKSKAAGTGGNPKGEKGMHVIVHEAVHGHSPIRQEQFKGRYRLLEEATTELAARKVMNETFGTPWEKLSGEYGAYHEFCESLRLGVDAALKRKGHTVPASQKDWGDFLGEAAVEMRRRPPPQDPDKWAYLKRFASSLPLSDADLAKMGGAEAVHKEVAGAVWLSLKTAGEEEKLRMALGKVVKAGFYDPKNIPPEVAAALAPFLQNIEKAKAEWAAYLAGSPLPESRMAAVLASLRSESIAEKLSDEDRGMLPRNDLQIAIAYARVLSAQGALTPGALRDLILLQDDVRAAAKAIAAAVEEYDLDVVEELPA